MTQYDASSAECLVFTFKDGLLSPIAHDLKIRVGRFTVNVSEDAIDGEFDASSLQVQCAMRDGREDESALSRGDKQKIEGNIRKDVLASSRFPSVRFVSSAISESEVRGELSLRGKSRPIVVKTSQVGDEQFAEVTVHQPDFGIKPFTAALGTLKVKPDVRVQLRIRAR